jgi:hypothetical protein
MYLQISGTYMQRKLNTVKIQGHLVRTTVVHGYVYMEDLLDASLNGFHCNCIQFRLHNNVWLTWYLANFE